MGDELKYPMIFKTVLNIVLLAHGNPQILPYLWSKWLLPWALWDGMDISDISISQVK